MEFGGWLGALNNTIVVIKERMCFAGDISVIIREKGVTLFIETIYGL